MPDQTSSPKKLHLAGGTPPLIPELAAVMPAASALADQLTSQFAPVAAGLSTQQAYWIAFNGWMTDRLSGPIMEGKVNVDEIGEQAWAIYASSYWGGLELREHWGMPPAFKNMGMTPPEPPFAEVQQGMIAALTERLAALRAGGDACLAILPSILREASPSAPVHGVGYNAGVQVVKTEDPPIGQRRPHRMAKPAAVRINARDFLRVDYDMATPQYLKVWRSAFERAVTAHPDAYEAIIVGGEGDPNLRDIWKTAVNFGNTTWGGDAQDIWTDAYWEESIRWASIVTFGMEATAQAAFVALLNGDADAAVRAVLGNTLYQGTSWGWLIGMLDVDATLPHVEG
jgi:hypothetical protein